MKLAEKVALVTGSSKGIGRAIAIRLAAAEVDIVIDYRADPDGTQETKAKEEIMKIQYTYTRLNVENYAACKRFYQEVLGFEVLYANDAQGYAELATGETTITILDRSRLREFIGSTTKVTYDPHDAKIALTFRVANLDESISELKDRGVTLVNNPWQRPEDELMQAGVLTTCFCDPDGNLIEFFQMLS